MSIIQTANIEHELPLAVRYVYEPAESDVGARADVEILSVEVCGVSIPLDAKLYDAIREELLESELN